MTLSKEELKILLICIQKTVDNLASELKNLEVDRDNLSSTATMEIMDIDKVIENKSVDLRQFEELEEKLEQMLYKE